MINNFVIEGVDRLGKDTLIKNLLHVFGYKQVIHYQKPLLLDFYGSDKTEQARRYQQASFEAMFKLLNSDVGVILNRAHLGEYVYAPRYRNYPGNYVFDLERSADPKFLDTSLLILLMTSDFSFIKDDGESFDFSAKEAEQADFMAAFRFSSFKHKLLLDVSNGVGGFVDQRLLVSVVVNAIRATADQD